MTMRKIKQYTITDKRKGAKKVRDKTFKMVETKEGGELIPRDPNYPLDGPGKIGKDRAKEKVK
jgi:hypothetical protein